MFLDRQAHQHSINIQWARWALSVSTLLPATLPPCAATVSDWLAAHPTCDVATLPARPAQPAASDMSIWKAVWWAGSDQFVHVPDPGVWVIDDWTRIQLADLVDQTRT